MRPASRTNDGAAVPVIPVAIVACVHVAPFVLEKPMMPTPGSCHAIWAR